MTRKWLYGCMAKLYILKYVFKYVFLVFLFFMLLPTSVSAATFTVSEVPAQMDANQSFKVKVELTVGDSAGKDYYIRPTFAHTGALTSYFGYIKNHVDSWYNGRPTIDYTQYRKVKMNEFNSWSDMVEIKPDPDSQNFKGNGTYILTMRYYTETGNLSPNKSNSVQIEIAGAASSPTPSPSPSPSPTPSPTPTASPQVSPLPSPSPKPSPTPSPKVLGVGKTATPSPSPIPTKVESKEDKLVLGQATSTSPSPQAQPTSRFGGNTYLAFGLMGLGLVLIIFSAYTFLKPRSSDTITIDNG